MMIILTNKIHVFTYSCVNSGDQVIESGAVTVTWTDEEGRHELNMSCYEAEIIADELKRAAQTYRDQK